MRSRALGALEVRPGGMLTNRSRDNRCAHSDGHSLAASWEVA